MIALQLLNNKVLVKPIEKENTTSSGFILPTQNKEEKIQQGEVVAVGNGSRNEKGERIKLDVQVGQKIMYEYSSYGAHEIEMNNERYYLISETDIIGVINK